MATSLAECDEILAAAKKNDRLLSVMAQNRFKRPLRKLKQVLDSGLIGKIIHAQVDSFWWRGSNYYDLWWRGTWEKEGGGCTMNHAVHHIDLFQWMAGMPNEVQAVITNLAHDNSEVEDFSTTVFFFENGALGQVTASLVHHGEEQQVVIQGERAMVAIPWKVIASRQMASGFPEDDPETAAEIQTYYEGLPDLKYTDFEGQIDNMLSTIAGEETLLIDGESGRRTLELVTAIYQSGTTGERVKLPFGSESPFYTREGILEAAPRFYEKTRSVENVDYGEITFGRDF
jgi:predicted dehydrogenase